MLLRNDCVFALLVVFALVLDAHAQLPSPELVTLKQLGGTTGQPYSGMGDANGQLLQEANCFACPGFLTAESTLSSDLKEGLYSVHALSKLGLSNSRSVFVSKSPWELVGSHESIERAVPLQLGHYYQAEMPQRGRHYYLVRSEVDAVWKVETIAYPLESRARLVLALLDSHHRTHRTAAATVDRDVSLEIALKANEIYTLVVYDHLYRGGPEYRYALHAAPGVPLDRSSDSLMTDWRTAIENQHKSQSDPLDPRYVMPRIAMLRPPAEAPLAGHDENQFPNDKPMQVALPSIIVGDFGTNDDVDLFEVECEAGETIVAEVVSQRLGEITDPVLLGYRVERNNEAVTLHRMGENDDLAQVGNGEVRFGLKDSLLTLNAPQKGTIRIALRNLQRRDLNLPAPRYALEIRRPKLGFSLAANLSAPVREADQASFTSATVSKGGCRLLSVHAIRWDGFAEVIELNVEGASNRLQGVAGVIARDQNQTTLALWDRGTEPKDALPEVFSIQVLGKGLGVEQAVVAAPLEVIRPAIDTFRAPISKLTQSLQLCVAESSLAPITIALGNANEDAKQPILVSAVRGQPCKIPVIVTRRPGGEVPVIVRLKHTAPKTSAGEIRIEGNVAEGVLDLQVPKDAPLGEYLVGALCEVALNLPNPDPNAAEKTKQHTLQWPSSNVRLKIGDAP